MSRKEWRVGWIFSAPWMLPEFSKGIAGRKTGLAWFENMQHDRHCARFCTDVASLSPS